MIHFVAIYLLLYGGMQAWVWRRGRPLLPDAAWPRRLWPAWLALMVLGPVAARQLEYADMVLPAQVLGHACWSWMIASLWFLMLDLLLLAWNRGCRRPALARWRIPPRAGGLLIVAAIAALLAWGLLVAGPRLAVREVEAPVLPPGSAPLRAALVSDLHVGLYTAPGRLDQVFARLAELRPDLVLSAGDMIDSARGPLAEAAGRWAACTPPLGKYAVLGNHDFYAGLEASLGFHRTAGFRLLRGEAVEAAPGLVLAGVDDPTGRLLGADPALARTPDLWPWTSSGRAVVLLKHQPLVTPDYTGPVALQLSGHTHAGQVFPFNLLVALRYPFHRGWYERPGGGLLFVSPGTGTWGTPVRLFTTAEITLIRLVAARPATLSSPPPPAAGTP